MAWTTPTTRATGVLVTASIWNTDLVDNLAWLHDPPACRVYNSGNISISSGTPTALTFDTERFDTDAIHDTGSNTSRLTAKTAGVYIIAGSIEFASAPNSAGYVAIKHSPSGNLIAYQSIPNNANARAVAACIYKLAVNDYVELVVNQNTGGPININAVAAYSPEFEMAWTGAG